MDHLNALKKKEQDPALTLVEQELRDVCQNERNLEARVSDLVKELTSERKL